MVLDAAAQRILGSLMEKEMTTPELYPLSLNGLVAAANQKTSRHPLLELSEEQTRSALDTLAAHELISVSRDSRVSKFEHRIRTVLDLRRDETALICLLLLRGPQTAGELRGRAERMFSFDDVASVQVALDRLARREAPLVRTLPKAPGAREARVMHLLGGDVAVHEEAVSAEVPVSRGDQAIQLMTRVLELERRVSDLEAALKLKQD